LLAARAPRYIAGFFACDDNERGSASRGGAHASSVGCSLSLRS
jgi:hypothetical protein